MELNEFLERNISTLLAGTSEDKAFGVTHVQKVCRIGYNQACHTIDFALEQGILRNDDDKNWLYRVETTCQ